MPMRVSLPVNSTVGHIELLDPSHVYRACLASWTASCNLLGGSLCGSIAMFGLMQRQQALQLSC
jgi:hypothetical protein